MTEIHKNEPSLDELKKIMREVVSAESTPENVKKLQAIMAQIERHEAAAAEKKEIAKKAAEQQATQEEEKEE
jgi:hypothetical protein